MCDPESPKVNNCTGARRGHLLPVEDRRLGQVGKLHGQ